MNFYSFHIGDYASATRHLTWLEDAAYRRLLDVYYVKEGPLPPELRQVYRLAVASTPEQREAIDAVLEEFFVLTEQGYTHMRCEAEIARAADKRSKAAQSANARWGNAKKQADVLPKDNKQHNDGNANASETACDGMPKQCDGNAPNPNPNPNTSVPIGTGSGKPPPITDPQEIIFGYGLALLTNAGTAEKQARSFLGGLRKQHGDAELVNKLRDCAKAKPLQPLEWLAAALPPASMAPKLNAQEALEAANRSVAERFLAEEAAREAV